jgi:spermidine synthase
VPSWTPRLAYPIVFIVGFVILLLEISAGRLLAPGIGVSLETWTGVIGIVLAGLAIGDAAGGWVIDKYPTPRVLAGALVVAGIFILATPVVSEATRGLWPSASLAVRVVATSGAVLLAPGVFLGAVSPIASRLALRSVRFAGWTVGGLSAVGSTSGVLGVALGGFLILERFGVRSVVLACGAGLVALGAMVSLVTAGAASDPAPAGARSNEYDPARGGSAWPIGLYLLPAVAGASVMVVELAASRLASMMFGTSLYTWTSVIGVVLAGISIGAALGGWLADRYVPRRLLGALFLLAGAATLWVLMVSVGFARLGPLVVRPVLASLPPAVGLPLLFGVMLLPASLAFGAITPVAIRLGLREVGDAGHVVGWAFASQAAGSIVGTFATGLWLIADFGARAVIVLIAAVAFLTAGTVGMPVPGAWRRVVGAAVALGAIGAMVAALAGWVPSPCLRESNYYCIRVRQQGEDLRALVLDSLVHSYVNLKDPTALLYEYEQGFAMVMADHSRRARGAVRGPLRMLFVGGGGYAVPRYAQHVYPTSSVDVVEIDPAVTEVTFERLGLSRHTPIRSWNEDGRQFFLRNPARRYDLVFGDAFRDAYSVPYHLTTVEFARTVAAVLEPDGVYAVNIIDGRSGVFLRSYVQSLRHVFSDVHVLPVERDWQVATQTTFVVLASQRALDVSRIIRERPPGVPANTTLIVLPTDRLERFLGEGPAVVLTDDRAPVENLLAGVYRESLRHRPP